MAKGYVYQVSKDNSIIGVRTIKQVSELLGEKVTKKDIEEGLVENVTLLDDPNMELTEEQIAELEEEGTTILEAGTKDTEEIEEIEDDSEETVEDSNLDETLEEQDGIESSLEDDTEDDSEEDADEEENIEEENNKGEVSMTDLLAKLQANNEKIAKENPEKLQKTSKKRSKVMLECDEDGNVVYPEKGYFKDENHIKKYYKQLDNNQLDEWLELEGLEYKPCEHEGIDRMRKCMAIKDYHFPKEPTSKKSKSPYAKFSTEELLQMALDNDVEVKDAKGNMKILRMYTIIALRDAGIIG